MDRADKSPASAGSPGLAQMLTRRAVIDAATKIYLDGESLDMRALAGGLGIGRSTLYRLVGNRADLLGIVLAEATERTFRQSRDQAASAGGADLILEVLNHFMHAVAMAPPLQALCAREPLQFVQLALNPGRIEQTASRLIAEMLQFEVDAGNLELPLPAATVGVAIVRMCDAHLYAPLLGRTEPEIDTALELVAALLGQPWSPPQVN
ncbi:QsdR family transcriptional regulator [Nocardia sp. NPDC056611]|uniref:QsdR family transcriptional regulator n=1 Tax=Nocardia sp. NPDC056611 TaxID=3345877 RepID=UPI00366FB655